MEGGNMIGRTRRVLCLALLCAAGTLTTTAGAQAAALQLGTVNTSNATTSLKGSTGGPEFYVMNSNGGQPGIKAEGAGGDGPAILGVHTSPGGTGPGIEAISNSTQSGAYALFGLLSPSAPGFISAAVRGQNNGTNANGYGVYGSHAGGGVGVEGSSVSGSGVFGTSSTGTGGGFSGATGVVGTSFATNGNGVRGVANQGAFAAGVSGATSTGAGVYGESTGGTGQGVSGFSTAPNGVGVIGQANNGAGAVGVFGKSASGTGGRFDGPTGVSGLSTTADGTGVVGAANVGANARGVWGNSTTGRGVVGSSSAANGTGVAGYAFNGYYASGVYGESVNGYGVFGKTTQTKGWGVYGLTTAFNGKGIVAEATGGGDKAYAIMATNSGEGFAGYFKGDISVDQRAFIHELYVGYCSGCGVGPNPLKVDHPQDPAHKYLQHAMVASSEQLDLYSGNAVTDGKGFVTVRLPSWFEALNRDFRYQLTVVGKAHWDAKAAVWEEMAGNRFTIRTDQPQVTVSWQVSAVRHDAYANAHRGSVEVRKEAENQGKYLHPELYGKPRSAAIR